MAESCSTFARIINQALLLVVGVKQGMVLPVKVAALKVVMKFNLNVVAQEAVCLCTF